MKKSGISDSRTISVARDDQSACSLLWCGSATTDLCRRGAVLQQVVCSGGLSAVALFPFC